jgi:cytoskeletal protein CcmA (bactofilin family)
MGERDRGTGQPGGIDAFLGKGTTISGKLVFEGPGRIEGKVEGEIAAHDTLTVGEGAVVNAKVSGTSVVVEGQVTGDIVARQRLELRPTGRVTGNISAPSLVIHEGAILNGQCSMSGTESKTTTTTTSDGLADLILDRARDSAAQVASLTDSKYS